MKNLKSAALWAVLLWACGQAVAQDRSLYWDSLTVSARLDADGLLHVMERHAMVFDGPWNGGERSFQLRSWQDLELLGFSEIHADTQSRLPWIEGELDQVGRYQRNGNVLRWRARMPSDPPFAQAAKTYEIAYTLSGILVPEGEDAYRLEHDLAFPQRAGAIRVFDAVLDIDPIWQADALQTRWHMEDLQPGDSVFVSARLHHQGVEPPRAVAKARAIPSTNSAPALRYGLIIALTAFAVAHAIALLRRERARGRFEPTLPYERIDEAWLQANVFNLPPEVVGAAWDLDTSASEVAALLARLEQEGALKSRVQTQGFGWLSRQTMHMELLCDRDRLAAPERELIDALFVGGSRTTSTERIREHYSKRGFTPAALIKEGIERQLPLVFASKLSVPAWARWLTALLLVGGISSFIVSAVQAPDTAHFVIITSVALLGVSVFGLVFGYIYRTQVIGLKGRLLRTLICVGILCGIVIFVLIGGIVPIVATAAVAIALLASGFVNMIFNIMRTRETPEALALRRQLGAARLYFERELRCESPRLKDAWFPYLLAFGLGPKIDRWFKSFGAESSGISSTGMGAAVSSSASGSSSSSSSSSWTGGGGSFGGAGASGSWAAAVGGIAAGVAKPSSSGSSSRGGGSSSSSGGGGGGGW